MLRKALVMLIVVAAAGLASCVSTSSSGDSSTQVPIPRHTSTPIAPPTTTLSPQVKETPGLFLQGTVKDERGQPLGNVTICRAYASYSGEAVATTDQWGNFRPEMAFLPGDEMVRVWAYADGYFFQPEIEYWRHYYGFELKELSFTAFPISAGDQAPVDCR